MNDFYLLDDDGQPALNDEAEAIAKVRQGLLSPDAYYWKEGMPEWQPLRDLAEPSGDLVPVRQAEAPTSTSPAAAQVVSSPEPHRFKSTDYYLRKELQPWTVLLEIALVLSFLLALAGLAGLWSQPPQISSPDSSTTDQSPLDFTAIPLVCIVAAGIILLANYVLFFLWVYRGYKNCRGFTANIRFTSGWAVGYFFIPIWNLFRPYRVMQEIWKISGNPYKAQALPDSFLIRTWWTLWLFQWLIAVLLIHPPHEDFIMDLTSASLGASALNSVVTLVLVHLIYLKQKRLTKDSTI